MVIFWYLGHISRSEMGFAWGRLHHYGLALLHPLLVMGLIALIAWGRGAIHLEDTNWPKVWRSVALQAVLGILIGLITEEGFFRGWLWASLQRTGLQMRAVLLCSSVAFALWHWSAALLDPDFKPPLGQVPLFLVNAGVMGAIWGMLRLLSGSLVVSSLCHSVWNAFAYSLFGLGSKVGGLGIQETGSYGPELGILGLVLNLLLAVGLWQWGRQPPGQQASEIPATR
jgi:membrane protease YdiL (CAAX protease family)